MKRLKSSTAQTQASFDGDYLHPPLFEVASAYLNQLVLNQPFVVENERVALASALIFLELIGIKITEGTQELYELTMEVYDADVEPSQSAHRTFNFILRNSPTMDLSKIHYKNQTC